MDTLARDDFSFVLLGPQAHVGAGGEWYLRSAGSLTGQAGVLPSLETIAAINPAAVNGDPNTAASGNLTILVGNSTGRNVTVTSTTASALSSTSTLSNSASSTSNPTASSDSTEASWVKPVKIAGGVVGTFALLMFFGWLWSLRMRRHESYVKSNTLSRPDTSAFSESVGGGIAHQYSKIEMDEMKPIVRSPNANNPINGNAASSSYTPQFQQNGYTYQQQQQLQQGFVVHGQPPQSAVTYVPIQQQWK
ncbi:hypothetical protein HK100_011578 [Physocladia obscura]|uniref:Transmembrane protein n=1 Tax=Physocladia obscura TaxID=109957 RepID=A0AAD5T105_9FUNG|nr:hypothetical protein HK100_011578 [Physocladia obscura]